MAKSINFMMVGHKISLRNAGELRDFSKKFCSFSSTKHEKCVLNIKRKKLLGVRPSPAGNGRRVNWFFSDYLQTSWVLLIRLFFSGRVQLV